MMPEPVTYLHSLKLEETAKGLIVSVHVYSNDQEQAIREAFQTYLKVKQTAMGSKNSLCTDGIQITYFFLLPFGFKIQYEIIYDGGESHIIARKLTEGKVK